MAKRYGRNQKRAARAREAALVAREAELLKHLGATNELLSRLERAASEIIAAHHEYSAFVPVKPGRPEIRRLPMMSRFTAYPVDIGIGPIEYKVSVLNELRSVIDFDSMHDNFTVHLLVNDRPEWAYKFSGKAFNHRLMPPTARREIAEAMVGQLLHYVDKKWPDVIRRGLDQPRG